MKELSASESSYHKSRAGTAYSVAHRLLSLALLEWADADEKHVLISAEGLKALQEWLAPPLPMADIAHSADLIRLRMFFLGSLPKDDRLKFVDDAIAKLQTFLARCEGLLTENERIGDYFGMLATVSSVLETRARIQWLDLVRSLIEKPLPEGAAWTEEISKLMNR